MGKGRTLPDTADPGPSRNLLATGRCSSCATWPGSTYIFTVKHIGALYRTCIHNGDRDTQKGSTPKKQQESLGGRLRVPERESSQRPRGAGQELPPLWPRHSSLRRPPHASPVSPLPSPHTSHWTLTTSRLTPREALSPPLTSHVRTRPHCSQATTRLRSAGCLPLP